MKENSRLHNTLARYVVSQGGYFTSKQAAAFGYPHAHGAYWQAARRRHEGPAASRLAGPPAAAEVEFWTSPDFSRTSMPPGFPDALRSAAKRFLDEYRSQLRPFAAEHEVVPGIVVRRTGGPHPGHSVVRLGSGDDRLTFAGDAVFQVGFDQPEWHNGFEHDPEEAARVRVRLLRELAASRELLVATHLPFPSVGHVAVAGEFFIGYGWDY